jgi:hypothetical protein
MHKSLVIKQQVEASEKVATGVEELKTQIAGLATKADLEAMFSQFLETLARNAEPVKEVESIDTQTPANVQTTRTVNRSSR